MGLDVASPVPSLSLLWMQLLDAWVSRRGSGMCCSAAAAAAALALAPGQCRSTQHLGLLILLLLLTCEKAKIKVFFFTKKSAAMKKMQEKMEEGKREVGELLWPTWILALHSIALILFSLSLAPSLPHLAPSPPFSLFLPCSWHWPDMLLQQSSLAH